MKKQLLLLICAFASISAHASAGYTWIGTLIHKFHLPVQEHIATFLFVILMLTLVGVVYRQKVASADNAIIPDRGFSLRNVVEAYGSFIYSQCRSVLGEAQAPKYFKFVATIFIVIFVSNAIGLIPGFLPPTENLSMTLALGAFSFIYYNVKGCKEVGTINYLKHFAGPLWYMAVLIFPIEILSNFIRPVSLALRLRGNMMGDHQVLSTFLNLEIVGFPIAAIGGAIPFYLLGLLVCFIQAYVFTMLSMVYISLATAHHDHGEHH